MPTFTFKGETRLGETHEQTTDDLVEAVASSAVVAHTWQGTVGWRSFAVYDADGFDVTPVLIDVSHDDAVDPATSSPEDIEAIYNALLALYKVRLSQHERHVKHEDNTLEKFTIALHSDRFEEALAKLLDTQQESDEPPASEETAED